MDTLTHALSGALAGRLLARQATEHRPAPPAWQMVTLGFIVGAFPDSDFLLGYVSELAYLRGHRGVTHSLVLLPVWGLLLAWVMAMGFRACRRRSHAGPAFGWKDYYLVTCVALLVHILGDLITQFGTMLLAPFSDARFGWGTTFIIDLGLSAIVLLGLLASAIWRRSRVPAGLAALAVVAWIGNSAMARGEALEVARAHAERSGIPAVVIDAAPRPASPYNWTAIIFDGDAYHFAHINTRRSEPLVATPDDTFIRRFSAPYQPVDLAQWESVPRFGSEMSDFVRTAWDAEAFGFFRWFAMFPVLDRVEMPAGTTRCAAFRDLRFETPGRARQPFRYGVCTDNDLTWRAFALDTDGMRWLAH